jgi:hypothetical protein
MNDGKEKIRGILCAKCGLLEEEKGFRCGVL